MDIFKDLVLPDIMTLTNAVFGLLAIFAAFSGQIELGFVFVLVAAVADGMDGYLARTISQGPMGEYLDSLADAVSFGVAPACLIYLGISGLLRYAAGFFACMYLVCGILRLARFNTKKKTIPDFEGLPITASAVVLSSYALLAPQYIYSWVIFGLVVLLCYLMISDHPYPKLRGPRAMGAVSVLFFSTILSYFLLNSYMWIFSTILFLSLMLYLESPIMRIPRQYYEK
ncbi:archaetidylserine synthase [Methanohalophilus portucalensis]|uniref:CDP-diacylglycerol--serine O-phosphatidyltransferase n=2 Tax=Methanohalophilus portucalensis TaxID=39664 RepID=A0A1L9C628_9EURY|nr:archaetidylserine synthase [Methanohalophilus portucalensis]ATU08528.1 archaetidylserine synthase [Methanohalophilus portucalensis]OJH49888.1 CDP-diacylglycerol/serineO-phosphatidyltransferase [Methanohalophilus portucalensis FDF-1]RNI13301.1 archaetidylserine synthase [Methanohalophilus portucalensis FDF-1]SMH33126.1 archaetidylserine synthase [Methanohalophilus portucalensis FDF-1]